MLGRFSKRRVLGDRGRPESPLLGERHPVNDGGEGEVPVRSVRVLPRTAIYPAGIYERSDGGVKTAGDRLRSVLRDGQFHAARVVLGVMSVRDFARAVGELQSTGYAVDVAVGAVRLRPKRGGEVLSSVASVVAILESCPVLDTSGTEQPTASRSDVERVRGAGDDDQADESPVDETGLVLSDPPSDLTVPFDWVAGMTCAVLGKRGVGKTCLAGVLVEELKEKVPDLPVAVVDPTGGWWGLAASSTGEPSDLGVVLLGGERGVAEVSARSGRAAADLVHELAPRPVVSDLSRLAKLEQVEFAADFFARLLTFKQFPVHVVLDEADVFVPQRFGALGGDHRRCADAVEEYFMRGRLAGRGGTIVSLRPAVVSKNVLSQVDCLFLLRMMEPNDLRAVESWLEHFEHGVTDEQREECLNQMSALPKGTAYFLRGGEQATFRRFQARVKHTYDSSRTFGSVGSGVVGARCAELPADVLDRVREVVVRAALPPGEDEGE